MADVLVAACKDKDENTIDSHEHDRQTFVEIGTTILTARSCDMVCAGKLPCAEGEPGGHSRQVSVRECEIFQPIQTQVRFQGCIVCMVK